MWGMNPPGWLFRPPLSMTSAAAHNRRRLTVIATAATILAFIIFAFVATPRNWATGGKSLEPVAGIRPYTGWPDPLPWDPPHPRNAGSGWTPAERLIVKVRLEDEDVSWLEKIQWMWRNEVITIKPMYSNAHPKGHRPDKGRVANEYLKWIIENYHHLPETLVLLPPDDPEDLDPDEPNEFDVHAALRHFQVPFVQSTGFANLQCPTKKSKTTCNDKVLISNKPNYELRTLEAKIPEIWKALFGDGEPGVPVVLASVLGSTFAVSKKQIQKRSLDDYLKYWSWLNKTIMDDDSSGLVFEYLWHVVFGKEAVYCPDRAKCECDTYGECD